MRFPVGTSKPRAAPLVATVFVAFLVVLCALEFLGFLQDVTGFSTKAIGAGRHVRALEGARVQRPFTPVRAMGCWREGSALDRADKRLSGPIFKLNLPAFAEMLFSVPGAFMGFPHAFFGPTPLALACFADTVANPQLTMAAIGVWVFGMLLFYGALFGCMDLARSAKVALLAMPLLSLSVLANQSISSAAWTAGRMSITCSALVVAASIPLKAMSNRQRPAVSLKLQGEIAKRRCAPLVPYIQGMCTGGQSHESLPSSDSAVMASNAALLWHFWSPTTAWLSGVTAILVVLLSCFFRMYIWAHHVLDVFMGGVLGALVATIALRMDFGAQRGHVVASLLILILSLLYMQKRTRIFDRKRTGRGEPGSLQELLMRQP